jgi:hypothetical protein
VLHPSGVCFLNVGDSYSSGDRATWRIGNSENKGHNVQNDMPRPKTPAGLKPKDLIGQPWRLAFALQADGWYLRQDIIWHKPNAMPESVTDRCTKCHEYIFLLTKSEHYFFDAEAVKEQVTGGAHPRAEGRNSKMSVEHAAGKENSKPNPSRYSRRAPGVTPKSENVNRSSGVKANNDFHAAMVDLVSSRNKRSVWRIASESYPGDHHATFPTALVKPCVLAGTSARGVCPRCMAPWERLTESEFIPTCRCGSCDVCGEDAKKGLCEGAKVKPFDPIPATVMDPFFGTGTTGEVALELGRSCIGIELYEESVRQAKERCGAVTPGLKLF